MDPDEKNILKISEPYQKLQYWSCWPSRNLVSTQFMKIMMG